MKKYVEEFRKFVMGMSEEDLGVITDKFINETGGCPNRFGMIDTEAPDCSDREECWRKALEAMK